MINHGPIDYQNQMNIIWHNDPFIQYRIFKLIGNHQQIVPGNNTGRRQMHDPICDMPEIMLPVLGADGNKTFACLGVIISR